MRHSNMIKFTDDIPEEKRENNSNPEIGENEVTLEYQEREEVEQTLEETDILANSRRSHSIVDDVVVILLNSMMETITVSWESKPCMRPIPKPESPMGSSEVIKGPDPSGLFDPGDIEPTIESSVDVIGSKKLRAPSKKKSSRDNTPRSSHSSKTKKKGKRGSDDSEVEPGYSATQVEGKEEIGEKGKKKGKKESLKQITNPVMVSSADPDDVPALQSQKKRNSKERQGPNKEQRHSIQNEESKSDDQEDLPLTNDKAGLSKSAQDIGTEKQEQGTEDDAEELVPEWRVSFPDEDVSVVFTQGNRYEGRISRKLMEGYGCFSWTDGSKYEGEFLDGEMTGRGMLEWQNQSWYEGEIYCGHRHGKGIYVAPENYVTYIGGWYLGEKHGEGIIYYGNIDNYYEGEFLNGQYNGIGFRQYPSGACYIGEWNYGLRHGTGTMIWPNNDLYHGSWERGFMSGYGEYIWGAVINNQLVLPAENVYRGSWLKGLRHGKGTLEKPCGNLILAEWSEGLKDGPGLLLCADGTVEVGNPLYQRDHLAENPNDMDDIVCPAIIVKYEKHLSQINETEDNEGEVIPKKCKRRSNKENSETKPRVSVTKNVPKIEFSRKKKENEKYKRYSGVIESRVFHESRGKPRKFSPHGVDFDLSYHLSRLQDSLQSTCTDINLKQESYTSVEKKNCTSQNEPPQTNYSFSEDLNHSELADNEVNVKTFSNYQESFEKLPSDEETLKMLEFENKWLHQAIMLHLYELLCVYKSYATVACTEKPDFETNLTRIMFWQMERDCILHNIDISLVEVDEMLAENPQSHVHTKHEPFERLQFWQFIQYLLELSWLVYASKGLGYEGVPGILGSAFIKLVRDDILQNAGTHVGTALFKYRDILPIETVYNLYKSIGEPHSSRDLLNKICVQKGEPVPEPPPGEDNVPCWYPDHIRNGTNAIYVGGDLMYLPGPEPLSYSKTTPEDRNPPQDSHLPLDDPFVTQLTSFHKLGPTKVVDYLSTVCPAIKSEGIICNMDYKLTFLEFYEVLLLCAEGIIQKEAVEAAKQTATPVLQRQESSNLSVEQMKISKSPTNLSSQASRKKKKSKI